MTHYVLLDVTGIQKTVFETNKLKVILGASLQLAQWQLYCRDQQQPSGAVYMSSAGGNVLAGFDDDTKARKFIEDACLAARECGFAVAWALTERSDSETDQAVWQKLQVEIARFKAGDRGDGDYNYLPDLPSIGANPGNICVHCGMRLRKKTSGGHTDRDKACAVCLKRITLKEEFKKSKAGAATNQEMLYANHVFADDFEIIVGAKNGDERASMAVVVMDLNDMGSRVKRIIQDNNDGFRTFGAFSKTLEEELFTLFDNIITTVFANGSPPLPCQPLLFAGDDVAFVMHEDYWIPFVKEVFDGLKTMNIAGGPPTCGAGVVIAPHNFPINRLVDMAEELAGNAKRLFRHRQARGKDAESVLDWHVFQESAFASALEARRRLFLHVFPGNEAYMATDKPYTASAFEALCNDATTFWGGKLAETKRHGLYEALCHGPESTRDFLALQLLRDENVDLNKYDGVWQAVEAWRRHGQPDDPVLWHTLKTDNRGILPEGDANAGIYKTDTTLHYTDCADSMELYWMQPRGAKP